MTRFGKEKAGGQLTVVAGRAHDDGKRLAVNAHLQRLFTRGRVLFAGHAPSRLDRVSATMPDGFGHTCILLRRMVVKR